MPTVDEFRPWPSLSPSTTRRRRPTWHRAAVTAAVVALLLTVCPSAAANKNNLVPVVNIRTSSQNDCPVKCTGLLITNVIILTTATCADNKDIVPITTTTTTEDSTASAADKPITMENTLTPMTETTTPVTDISASSTDIPVVTNEKIVMAATRGWAHPKWYPMADTMSTETQMPITTTVTEIPNTMNTTTTEAPIISENRGEYVQPGAIRVYISLPNSEHRRDVVRKYIHPDWEPTTMVANLALLKLNSRFPNHLSAPIHSLIDNDLERLPNTFDFKGFGKINLKLYAEQFIDDIEAKRTVNASYNDSCPSYVDNKFLKTDKNWWAFLCSTNKFNEISNTLCTEDTGGPLYAISDGIPRVYGLFSHAYHIKYPFCATQLCYYKKTAPFPCSSNPEDMFYKYTALMGPYAAWVNQTIEGDSRITTVAPTCPEANLLTVNDDFSTMDPEYDLDVYSDRRLMVANHKVCPMSADSSTNVATTATAVTVAALTTYLRSI